MTTGAEAGLLPGKLSRSLRCAAGILLLVALCHGGGPLQGQTPGGGPVPVVNKVMPGGAREAVTESALRKQMEGSKKMADMRDAFQPAPAVKPSLEPSLYKRSIILFDGSHHTVVPIGAVLRLPATYRNRVIEKPEGEFIFWPAFLEKNQSWLGGWEVPLAMAKGDAELSKKVMKQVDRENRVLVAVYKSCPITVLEAEPESEGAGARRGTEKKEAQP